MQDFVRVAIYSMIASAIFIAVIIMGITKKHTLETRGSAIFIAVIIMFVLTSLTIEDNTYSISLLKVIGYNKKDVNSMILDSYKIYTIIAYLIVLPLTVVSMSFGMKYLASEFGMILPVQLNLLQAILVFVIVLIIFYLGTFSAKRKINKISLQET
ncbi:TPA: FtsX-like permease family protein [Clostridium perfringens]